MLTHKNKGENGKSGGKDIHGILGMILRSVDPAREKSVFPLCFYRTLVSILRFRRTAQRSFFPATRV